MPSKPDPGVWMRRHLATLAAWTRRAGASTPFRPSLVTHSGDHYILSPEQRQIVDEQLEAMRPGVARGQAVPLTPDVQAALAFFAVPPGTGSGASRGGAGTISDPRKGG